MVDRFVASVGRRSYLAVGTFRSVMLNLKLVLVVARYLESIGVYKHRSRGKIQKWSLVEILHHVLPGSVKMDQSSRRLGHKHFLPTRFFRLRPTRTKKGKGIYQYSPLMSREVPRVGLTYLSTEVLRFVVQFLTNRSKM